MKVNRQALRTEIEEIIANGAWTSEEVDITTDKVLQSIDPIIKALENDQNQKKDDATTSASNKDTGAKN